MTQEFRVLISGDPSQAIDAFQKVSDKAGEAGAQIQELGSLEKVMDGLTNGIFRTALGFGTLAGAGAVVGEKIAECLKAVIDFAPDAMKSTNKLAAEFQLMAVAAGMSVKDFNQMNAAVKMAGGQTEDMTAIVRGMQMGIRSNSEVLVANGVAANEAALKHMSLAEYIGSVVRVMNTYGDATDRDQLLMQAFARSGVAFSAQLVNMNKHMAEAGELAAKNGPLNQQSILDLEANRAAMANWGTAWEKVQATVSATVTPIANAAANGAAAFLDWSKAGEKLAAILKDVAGFFSSSALQGGVLAGVLTAGAAAVVSYGGALITWLIPQTVTAAATVGILGEAVAGATTTTWGLGAAMSAISWPITLAVGAVIGLGAALNYFAHEHDRSLGRIRDANDRALRSAQAWSAETREVISLEASLANAKGSEQHALAQERLDIATKALLEKYPDLANYLVIEKGHRISIAEAIERANKASLEKLRNDLASAEANERALQAGNAVLKKWNAASEADQSVNLDGTVVNPHQKEIDFNKREIDKNDAALDQQKALTAGLRDELNVRLAISAEKKNGHNISKDDLKEEKTPRYNPTDMWENKLEQQAIALRNDTTLEEQHQHEVDELRRKSNEDRIKLNRDLDEKDSTMTYEEYSRLWAKVDQVEEQGRANLAGKYLQRRVDMEEKLQLMITGVAQGGLQKRYAETERFLDQVKKLNAKLAAEGKAPMATPEQIAAARVSMDVHDLKEQAKLDLADLKRTLADEAALNGPMSRSELGSALDSYASRGASQAEAVKEFKIRAHWDQGASEGALAGLKAFTAKADSSWSVWNKFASDMLNGLTGAFAKFFDSITRGGMSMSQRMSTLWKGLADTVVKALGQMLSQQTVNWGAEKAQAAWEDYQRGVELKALLATNVATVTGADSATSMLNVETESKVISAKASEELAAANIWAAYGWLPGGQGIAAGLVAAMQGSLAALTVPALAAGALVASPTLALIGEAGPEIVAPQGDFRDWANANQNLGYNLAAHNASLSSPRTQSTGYGTSAQAQAAAGGPVSVDLRGAVIAGESVESSRLIGKLVKRHLDDYMRRNG